MIFFYTSSNSEDKLKNPISVVSSSKVRANKMVNNKFKQWGYKGEPVEL